MAYTKAEREEIIRTNTQYRDQIAGCLYTHARYLHDAQAEMLSDRELRQVASILASPAPHIDAVARAVIHYPTNDSLSDIASLTDGSVMDLIPALWPMLVTAWSGPEPRGDSQP